MRRLLLRVQKVIVSSRLSNWLNLHENNVAMNLSNVIIENIQISASWGYFSICGTRRHKFMHTGAFFFSSFWIAWVSSLCYCWSINIYLYMYIQTSYIIYIYFIHYILFFKGKIIFSFLVEEEIISTYRVIWTLYSFQREFIYIEFHRGMVLGFQIKLPICSKHSSALSLLVVFVCDNEF